jgi:hypothetical protein
MNISIALESVSPSGAKVKISVTADAGTKSRLMDFEVDDLRKNLDAEDRERLATLLVRAAVDGLTRAQARTKLQSGIVVTV